MTGEYEKFRKWTTELREDGYRAIQKDAPENIRIEAKQADEEYFKRTGRHMFHIDY